MKVVTPVPRCYFVIVTEKAFVVLKVEKWFYPPLKSTDNA